MLSFVIIAITIIMGPGYRSIYKETHRRHCSDGVHLFSRHLITAVAGDHQLQLLSHEVLLRGGLHARDRLVFCV